jgi:hypothetical protein
VNNFRWLVMTPPERRAVVARFMSDLSSAMESHLAELSRSDARTHISDLEEAPHPSSHPRYLLDGFYSHQKLENVAKRLNGYEVRTEVEGSYAGLVVTCDTLVKTPWGEKVVVEFKTSTSSNWKRVLNEGAFPHHVGRTRVYIEAFDADYGIIVYENRDTLEWIPVFVARDRQEADAYVQKLVSRREVGKEAVEVGEGSENTPQGG